MNTPLFCPRCRRPLGSGVEIEHGVCPLPASWEPRPVDWARDQRNRAAWSAGMPTPDRLASAMVRPAVVRMGAGVAEDYGDPCTPATVSDAVWRGRALWWGTWAAMAGLVSWLVVTAWQVWEMGGAR